jgi:hypothetical protein
MSGLRKLKRKNIDRYEVEPLRGGLEPQAWKLSSRILFLAKPLTDEADNDQFEGLIALAILCWNLALLPEDEQERELRSLRKKMATGETAWLARDVETWARMLIDRKKTLFGDDRRIVADYKVVVEGSSRHLFVTTPLVPD